MKLAQIFQEKLNFSRMRERQIKDERKFTIVDTVCAISAAILLIVLYYENELSEIEKVRDELYTYWARIVIILLTIVIDVCIILRYRLKSKFT